MLRIILVSLALLLSSLSQTGAIVPPAPSADSETKLFYEAFNESEWEIESECELNLGNGRKLGNGPPVGLSTRDNGGVLRVLVVLVRFTDHKDKILPNVREIDALFNANGIDATSAPTGSISAWFKANSYGRLKFDAEVIDWTLSNNTELYFASDANGVPAYGVTPEMMFSMYPILDQLDANGFNFTRFDADNDGMIDLIVLLHSGFAAEMGNTDCYTNATAASRIWSHAVMSPPNYWVSKRTGIRSNGYAVGAGIRGYCDSRVPRMGIITHEIMHTFGLDDLYDNGKDRIGKGLGIFDIMSYPYGRTGYQIHPGSLSPWSKMKIKWLDPIPIEYDGIYTIEASQLTNQTYIIKKGYSEGEYILIENRQHMSWDYLWTGVLSGGLLIWHIDDNANHRQRFRGYPGQVGWPGNGNHYQIALEQADRKFHLENGANNGDNGDFWRSGDEYVPGPIAKVATNASFYPNSNSYQRGTIRSTGIHIYDISVSNRIMTFRVAGLGTMPPTQAPMTSTHSTVTPFTNTPQSAVLVNLAPMTAPPATLSPGAIKSIPAIQSSGEPTKSSQITRAPTHTAPVTASPGKRETTTLSPMVITPSTKTQTNNIFSHSTVTPFTTKPTPSSAPPITVAPTTNDPVAKTSSSISPDLPSGDHSGISTASLDESLTGSPTSIPSSIRTSAPMGAPSPKPACTPTRSMARMSTRAPARTCKPTSKPT